MLKNRTIKVSTCTFEIADNLCAEHTCTWESNIAQAKYYLDKAGKAGSDIMVLPEFFNSKGRKEWFDGNIDKIHENVAESTGRQDHKDIGRVREKVQDVCCRMPAGER